MPPLMPHQWHGFGNGSATATRLNHMPRQRSARTRTPRDVIHEDGRQTLAMLRACNQTINMVLVALTDGVELEIWADGTMRRRSRFLRDTEARKYSERLSARLIRRGYRKDVELR